MSLPTGNRTPLPTVEETDRDSQVSVGSLTVVELLCVGNGGGSEGVAMFLPYE